MKQYRVTRKSGEDIWTVERKVWWGWKYDAYAIHVEAALNYIDEKMKEDKK